MLQGLVYEALGAEVSDRGTGERQQSYEGTGTISNQPSSTPTKKATTTTAKPEVLKTAPKQTPDPQPSRHNLSHDGVKELLEEYIHNGNPLTPEQKNEIQKRLSQMPKSSKYSKEGRTSISQLLKVIRQVVEESKGSPRISG